MSIFHADTGDLKRLQKFFKRSPQELPRHTAAVLNNLAFEAKKIDAEILMRGLIVRNRKFVETALQVQKTRPGRIESQVAYAGSIHRPRFTGWEEQETGAVPRKRHTATLSARGSRGGQVKSRARFRQGNQFYKPEQFDGRTLKQRFQFMMRVLGSRGGDQRFILGQDIQTRRGVLGRGMYLLRGHKIIRQRERQMKRTQPLRWSERTIHEIAHRKILHTLWRKQLHYLIQQGRRV